LGAFGRLALFQPDAAASTITRLVVADEFDPRRVKSADQLHQRVDISSDQSFPTLHALDCGHREIRKGRKFTLVDAEKSPRRPQLRRSDHGGSAIYYAPNRDFKSFTPYSLMSTIIIDVWYINLMAETLAWATSF